MQRSKPGDSELLPVQKLHNLIPLDHAATGQPTPASPSTGEELAVDAECHIETQRILAEMEKQIESKY